MSGVIRFTFLLMLSAAFQGFFTWRQLRIAEAAAKAAQDTADVARAALISTQRAFMSYEFQTSIVGAGTLISINIQTLWINRGQTPARNVRVWVGTLKRIKDPDDDYNFAAKRPDNLVPREVGPGMNTSSGAVPINFDDMGLLSAGKIRAYIFGQCFYKDVFDELHDHQTSFCMRLEPDKTKGDVPFRLVAFGGFNSSD